MNDPDTNFTIPPIIKADYQTLVEKSESDHETNILRFLRMYLERLLHDYTSEKLPTIFLIFAHFYEIIDDIKNAKLKLTIVSSSKSSNLHATLVAGALLKLLNNEKPSSQTIIDIIHSLDPIFESEIQFDSGFMFIVKSLCEKMTSLIKSERMATFDNEALYYNFSKKVTKLFLKNDSDLAGFVLMTQLAYQFNSISYDNFLSDFKNIIAEFNYVSEKKYLLEFYITLLGFFKIINQAGGIPSHEHINALIEKYLEFKNSCQLGSGDHESHLIFITRKFLLEQIDTLLQDKLRFQKYPQDAQHLLIKMLPFVIRLLKCKLNLLSKSHSDSTLFMTYEMLLYQSALSYLTTFKMNAQQRAYDDEHSPYNNELYQSALNYFMNAQQGAYDDEPASYYDELYAKLTDDIPAQLGMKVKIVIQQLGHLEAIYDENHVELFENTRQNYNDENIDDKHFPLTRISGSTSYEKENPFNSIIKALQFPPLFKLIMVDTKSTMRLKNGLKLGLHLFIVTEVLEKMSVDQINEATESYLKTQAILRILEFFLCFSKSHFENEIFFKTLFVQEKNFTLNFEAISHNNAELFSFLIQSPNNFFNARPTIQRSKSKNISTISITISICENLFHVENHPSSYFFEENIGGDQQRTFINNYYCLTNYILADKPMFKVKLASEQTMVTILPHAWEKLNKPEQLIFNNNTFSVENRSFQVDTKRLFTQENLFLHLQKEQPKLSEQNASLSKHKILIFGEERDYSADFSLFLVSQMKKFINSGWKIKFFSDLLHTNAGSSGFVSSNPISELMQAFDMNNDISDMSTDNKRDYNELVNLYKFLFDYSRYIQIFHELRPNPSLLSPNDPKTILILRIPNYCLGTYQGTYSACFPNDETLAFTPKMDFMGVEQLRLDSTADPSQVSHPKLSALQQPDTDEKCDGSPASLYDITSDEFIDVCTHHHENFYALRAAILKKEKSNSGSPSHQFDNGQDTLKTIYDLILSTSTSAAYESVKGTILLLFAEAYYIMNKKTEQRTITSTVSGSSNFNAIAKNLAKYYETAASIESYLTRHQISLAIDVVYRFLDKFREWLPLNTRLDQAQAFLIQLIAKRLFKSSSILYKDEKSYYVSTELINFTKHVLLILLTPPFDLNRICFSINFLRELEDYDLNLSLNELTLELDTLPKDDATILDYSLQLATYCKSLKTNAIDFDKSWEIIKNFFSIKNHLNPESKNHQIIQNEINRHFDTIIVFLDQNRESFKSDENATHVFYLVQLIALHNADKKADLQRVSLEYEFYNQRYPISSEKQEAIDSIKNNLLGEQEYQTILNITNGLKAFNLEKCNKPSNGSSLLTVYCPIRLNSQREDYQSILTFLISSVKSSPLFQISCDDQNARLIISISPDIFSSTNNKISQGVNTIYLINHLIETYFSIIDFSVKVLKCEIKFDEKRGFLININENSEPFLLYRAIAQISSIKNLYELKRIKNHFFMTPNQRTILNIHNQNNLSLSLNPSNIHLQEVNHFKENFSSLKNFYYQQKPVFHLPENPDSSTYLSFTLNSQFSNIDLTGDFHKNPSWLKRSNNSITISIQEMYQTQHLFSTWFNNITQALENLFSKPLLTVAPESAPSQKSTKPKARYNENALLKKLNETFSAACSKLCWIYDDETSFYQLDFKHDTYDILLNANQGGKGKGKAKTQMISKEILIAFFEQQIFTKSDKIEPHKNSIRFHPNAVSSTTLNRLKNSSQCFRGLEKFLEQNTPKPVVEKPVREKLKKKDDAYFITQKLNVEKPESSSNGFKKATHASNNENRIKDALGLAESLRTMLKDIYSDYTDFIHQENALSAELSYLYKDRLLFLLFILSGEYLQELSYAYHLEKRNVSDLAKHNSKNFQHITDPHVLYPWCLYILKGVKTVSNGNLIELVNAICTQTDKIELPSLPKSESAYLSKHALASCITAELAELQRLSIVKHDAVKDLRSKLTAKPYDAYEILAHILSLITYVNKFYPLFKNQPSIQSKLSALFSETKQLRNTIRHYPQQLFTKNVLDANSLAQFMKSKDKPFESLYQYNPDPNIIAAILNTLQNLDKTIICFEAIITELNLKQKPNGKLDDRATSSEARPDCKS